MFFFGTYYFLKGRLFHSQKLWAEAASEYKKAIRFYSSPPPSLYYKLGFVLSKRKKPNWNKVYKYISTAVSSRPENAQWIFRLGYCEEKRKNWREALRLFDRSIQLYDNHSKCHFHRGICLFHLKKYNIAESSFRKSISLDNTVLSYHDWLARCLNKLGRTWQELDVLEKIVELSSDSSGFYFRLAEANEKMGRFKDSSLFFEYHCQLFPEDSIAFYRLGYSQLQAGDTTSASSSFSKAIKLEPTGFAKRFGIGFFHQKRGLWKPASEEYERQLSNSPLDAVLHYRLGLSHDRLYNWHEAANSYIKAISIDPSVSYWHYRLGFVQERQGETVQAARSFSFAASFNSKLSSSCHYRAGLCLAKAASYDEACEEFLASRSCLKNDILEPSKQTRERSTSSQNQKSLLPDVLTFSRSVSSYEYNYLMATHYEKNAAWNEASQYFSRSIDRCDDHCPELFLKLGVSLFNLGRPKDACNAFLFSHYPMSPWGIDNPGSSKFFTSYYREFFSHYPIRKNTILYESFHGASLSCNPFAIFEHLLEREEFKDWTHIWVVKEDCYIPPRLLSMDNVIFIKRNSFGYLRWLSSASFLINNVTFPEYFVRKPEQIYLNTWHGTPIKHLGKDIKDSFLSHRNASRNFLQCTHIISPNKHTTSILLDRYDIRNSFNGRIALTGYPRIDKTLRPKESENAAIRDLLGVSQDSKVVLYAPTWRGMHGKASLDGERLVRDLQTIKDAGHRVFLRSHHMVESILEELNLGDIVVPKSIDTNSLLSVTDLLITDYSSIAVDFLVTGKPIIWYAFDLEDYQRERGLYFDLSSLPGIKTHNRKELCTALEGVFSIGAGKEYQSSFELFCPKEDGCAAQRVVDWVFFNKGEDSLDVTRNQSDKHSLLFYGGPFIPNGIAVSWLNLLKNIDQDKYNITICVDPKSIDDFPERREEFSKLPVGIETLGFTGKRLFTPEEEWLNKKFDSLNELHSDEMYQVLESGYSLEFQRLFGQAHFDTAIHFEGYNKKWVSLLGCAPKAQVARKVIYQHNDKYGEYTLRFPYLKSIFVLYRYFDYLISVSRATMQLNKDQLTKHFNLDPEKFLYCDNLQDPEDIIKRAEEDMDNLIADNFRSASHRFITLGRLSVEKDQEKMLKAFRLIVDKQPKAKLFILGEGPLRQHLADVIRSLKLESNAFLLGRKSNPYPYLKAADCFILSSNHEGQPMVLFEALVLGKSIVATDIVGNRSVLEGRPGLLVNNSVNGLVHGMNEFLSGNLATDPYALNEYQNSALQMFYHNVCGTPPLVN